MFLTTTNHGETFLRVIVVEHKFLWTTVVEIWNGFLDKTYAEVSFQTTSRKKDWQGKSHSIC